MAESQEKPAGILDAVSSVAQQATSVVSNALEAMHITAPNDQQNEDQQVNGKTEADLKDAADLEEGEIRQTNSKEEKQGPKTVFDDPASFNLKVSCAYDLDVHVRKSPQWNRCLCSLAPCSHSTHCTPHGHSISARPMLKTCRKRQLLRQQVVAPLKRLQTGWRISERLSRSIRSRNSGGKSDRGEMIIARLLSDPRSCLV